MQDVGENILVTSYYHGEITCISELLEQHHRAHPRRPSRTERFLLLLPLDGSLGVPREVLPHGLLVLDRASLSLNTDPIIVNQLSTLFDEKDRDDRGQFERKQ